MKQAILFYSFIIYKKIAESPMCVNTIFAVSICQLFSFMIILDNGGHSFYDLERFFVYETEPLKEEQNCDY